MATTVRSDAQITAAVAAGHEMAGMSLTAGDVAAMERVRRGESSIDDERDRILAEISVDAHH